MEGGQQPSIPERDSLLWHFGGAEFDGERRELSIAGRPYPMEAKPLAVLAELLSHAGEVVSRETLLTAAWPGVTVVPGSLATAISKLRGAFGEDGRRVIESVHRMGYRIGVPIVLTQSPKRARLATTLTAGDTVPNRPQWRLARPLGDRPQPDVWLAEHEKTGEARVFKFADTGSRLDALRREAAISRLLHDSLGDRPQLIRITEWNFDTRPFFIESLYGGLDLPAWAASRGGLGALELEKRLAIVADIAEIVAEVHGLGVLHRDIKPSNILVADQSDGSVSVRLVDFGAGRLLGTVMVAARITGMTLAGDEAAEATSRSGTLRYMAPEVMQGGPPSAAADVFALGIVLFQIIVGDLDRPLTIGWEADVPDALLRADISEAAAGDPSSRLASARLLSERLRSLPARREAAIREKAALEAQAALARSMERVRTRRPWLILAACCMLAGFAGVGIADLRAVRERQEAQKQEAIALSVDRFLTEDLLGQADPAKSGHADETLTEALSRAEARIDSRFAGRPLVAASVWLALAQGYDRRTAFGPGRVAFDHAISSFEQAEGPGSPDVTLVRLQKACLEASSFEPGANAAARKLMAAAESQSGGLGTRLDEAHVWQKSAQGLLEMTGGDVHRARDLFAQAADLADAMPATFSEERRLTMRRRVATAYMRAGKLEEAQGILDRLLPREIALNGPQNAETLVVRLNQAQVLMDANRMVPALAAFDSLYPAFTTVYGPDHRLTMSLLMGRAEALGTLERYDDAVRDDMMVYRAAAANEGESAYLSLVALTDAATSQCRAGHAEEGVVAARHAYDVAFASRGDTNTQTQVTAASLASCLITAGRFVEGSAFLDKVDVKAVGQLAGDPDYQSQIDLFRAAIAIGEGDRAAGAALLAGPRRVFLRADADPYYTRWTKRLVKDTDSDAKQAASGDKPAH